MKLLLVVLIIASARADVSHLLRAQHQSQSAQAQHQSAQSAPPQPSQRGADADAPILKQSLDVAPDGSYAWDFETGNGIAAEAQGQLKAISQEEAAQVVQGAAQWTAPDGTPVQFSYIADENGYQPQGAHLPTPPPVPAAILRALEWIAAHPPPVEPQQ